MFMYVVLGGELSSYPIPNTKYEFFYLLDVEKEFGFVFVFDRLDVGLIRNIQLLNTHHNDEEIINLDDYIKEDMIEVQDHEKNGKKVLLHMSGVHGVEGFAGSGYGRDMR